MELHRLALSSLLLWGLLYLPGSSQTQLRNLNPDEPGEEENLNRELWEFSKKTPYETLQPYLLEQQKLSQGNVPSETRLPNGWKITPAGTQIEVGNLPYEGVSYGGKIVVLNTGYYEPEGQEVSLIDPQNSKVIQTSRFPSLFPNAQVGLDNDLYISGGFSQKIYRLNSTFNPVRDYDINGFTAGISPVDKNHIAVLTLVTEEPETTLRGNTIYGQGKLIILNTNTGKIEKEVTVGRFPYAVQFLNHKLYVTLLGEDKLSVYDLNLKRLKTLSVGQKPQTLCNSNLFLYVVNTTSNTLSIINPKTDSVIGTLNLHYKNFNLGGSPTACVVKGHQIYVTQAELNAVAIFNENNRQKIGLIPTAWYPTKVLFNKDKIIVLNAKGIRPRRPNPNAKQPTEGGDNPEYVLNLLKGSVSILSEAEIPKNLQHWTRLVSEGSPIYSPKEGFKLPIHHIFYIIKENRTYDQVLGDLPQGNGDSKLTIFGKEVTPNHHKIASDFVTLDNFYANGEVSVLGHSFTTSGYASPFLEWLANARYSGRYNNYPFGIVPVTFSPIYLWNSLEAKGVNYRIYGEPYYIFTRAYQLLVDTYGQDSEITRKFYQQTTVLAADTDRGKTFSKVLQNYYQETDTLENTLHLLEKPEFVQDLSKLFVGDDTLAKALEKDVNFRRKFAAFLHHYAFNYHTWDLSYSDLQRFQDWQTDFTKQIKSGQVPQLNYIWLPNDHTAGLNPEITPPQFVAQNDAALGLIVEKISQSPIWANSLILVVEDDAQDGPDHVDANRTVSLAIGPFIKRGEVISDRYDQLSLLRTLEIILGLNPLNQNDALAVPMFGIFQDQPNLSVYVPPKPSNQLKEADQNLYQQIQSTTNTNHLNP